MTSAIRPHLTDADLATPSTQSRLGASQAGLLDDPLLDETEARPVEAPASTPRQRHEMLSPRLLCIRGLNYVTNHVIAHVPSFTLRRLWYHHALGIDFGPGATVLLGAYIWFFGPREIRRRGVAIGRNSRINRDCTLDIRSGLTIGENVSISPEVMILGGSHDYDDPGFRYVDAGPVTIEDHVWIGSRAMILPGVTLGRGAVVAAGSIVTKDVAPMMVVAGVPAKRVAVRDSGATAYEIGPPPLFE